MKGIYETFIAALFSSSDANSEKGVANGVATLDENGKIPEKQLPEQIGGATLAEVST